MRIIAYKTSIKDSTVVQSKQGCGMSLFTFYLMDLLCGAGYKPVLYFTPEFGVYNSLDRAAFLQGIKDNEDHSV